MLFLFFLLLFNGTVFTSALTRYGQHLAEFPIHEIVKNNAPLGVASCLLDVSFRLLSKKNNSNNRSRESLIFEYRIKVAAIAVAAVTAVNIQNLPVSIIFKTISLGFDQQSKNKCLNYINYFLNFPKKIGCWLCHQLAKSNKKNKTVFRKEILIFANLITPTIQSCWAYFLIYHFPWLWKKIRSIPPVNIVTFTKNQLKNRLAS